MTDENQLPISEQSLIFRLRKRSEIRRQIQDRKSVQEGQPDRIARLLDEAADEIERLNENLKNHSLGVNQNMTVQKQQTNTVPSTIYSFAQKCGLLNLRKNSDVEGILQTFMELIKSDMANAVANEQVVIWPDMTLEQKIYCSGLNDGIADAVREVKNAFLPDNQ
jgi:hypothetical protein